MSYIIEYLEKVVKADIPALPKSAKELLKRAIDERLTTDPLGYGKPLRHGLYGQRRIRVSVYRIIYTIDHEQKIVTIVAIGHRRDVYDN